MQGYNYTAIDHWAENNFILSQSKNVAATNQSMPLADLWRKNIVETFPFLSETVSYIYIEHVRPLFVPSLTKTEAGGAGRQVKNTRAGAVQAALLLGGHVSKVVGNHGVVPYHWVSL